MSLKDVLSEVLSDRKSKPVSLKEFMSALERTGRGGDTKLVHVTDRELAMLKKMGGGTKNPETGLMEFRGGDGGGAGVGGDEGAGGVGGGGGGSSGGDTGGGGGVGLGGDQPGAGIGRGAGIGPGRGRGSSAGDIGADAFGGLDRSGGFGRGNPTSVGEGAASQSDPIGAAAQGGRVGAANRGISQITNAIMSMTPLGPLNAIGMQMGEEDRVGISSMAESIGNAIGRMTGVGVGEVGPANPLDPATADIQLPQEPPVQPEFPPLTRPDAAIPPDFLGVQQAMTPLQQRAYVATGGLSSEMGGFRSPEAQDYYKNTLMRDLITDTGEIAPGAQLLPIETQYMNDIMGLSATPDMEIEKFARTLQGLPLEPPPLLAEPERRVSR